MSDEFRPIEIKEEEKFSQKRYFAETSITSNAQTYTARISKYTAERIIELLESPYYNAQQIQEVSWWLYYNSGIYNRLINNFAGMNRYDLYLYPTVAQKFVKDGKKKTATEKILKEYMDIAKIFEKYSYKANFRNIGTNLLIQGEIFLYTIEDNNGTLFKEIPSDMCKICKVINDGLYKYAINISKLSNEQFRLMMPVALQELYEKHASGSLDEELYVDNTYVMVDDPNAICLSLNSQTSTKSIPPLSYIFPSLIRLIDEEAEEIAENRINNLKLIHMKYALDDEGEPIVPEGELRKMHLQAKANLPAGVAINTNPLEVTTHTLQRSGSVTTSSRQTLTELVYNNAGVNSELFNGNSSNNQAIISGILADEVYCDTLNNLFENYCKYMIKCKKKNPLWAVRFVRNTKYNESTMITEAQSGCTVGLSRLKFLATQHYSPLEGIAILEFETTNGIDELFVPLATAYTQSAEESNSEEKKAVDTIKEDEEKGRPKNSENTDTSKNVGENKDSTNQ